jgi:hypothetical protein
MNDVAIRYTQVLANLAKAGVNVKVTESREGQLVSVRTAHGVHVFTIAKDVAI